MNANDLLDLIGEARGTFVWDAQQVRAESLQGKRTVPHRKLWLIAAAAALTLILVGCAVAYVLSLQELKIGERTTVEPERYGVNWEVIPSQEKNYELISVQGFSDSPNQQAVREWRDYLVEADLEYQAELTTKQRQEAQDKLDQILETYGLKRLGEGVYVDWNHGSVLLEALGIETILTEQEKFQVEYGSGNFFPEGNFDLSLTIRLEEENWPYPIRGELFYYRKGYFQYHYISLENLDSFQEWEYSLPDGSRVLLALGEEDGLILAEGTDGTYCVHLNARYGVDSVTGEMLQSIASLFDFSKEPKTLTEGQMDAIRQTLEEAEIQMDQEQQKLQEEYQQSLVKEDYDAWVKQILETGGKTLGYALLDVDGDGKEELLIGRDGYCTAVYWEVDGQIQAFSNAAAVLYPCEDQVIGYMTKLGDTDYSFSKLEQGTSRAVARVCYVPGHPEGEYRQYSLTQWGVYENITKEAFDAVLESYVRIPVTFLPLQDYPLEETVTPREQETGLYPPEDYETYEEKIRIRLTDLEERWGRWAYALRDLNGDGTEELIWREDDRYFIYTIWDGKVRSYAMISDGSLTVCTGGIVEAVTHYGPVNKTYRYYRLEKDRAVLVDYLRYDIDRDPESPWFRSPDLSGQDVTLEPISPGEAMTILASYEPEEMEMTPISEYPFS